MKQLAIIIVLLSLMQSGAFAQAGSKEENFQSWQYNDSLATTALWDRVSGTLSLYPFSLSIVNDSPAHSRPFRRLIADGDYLYTGEAVSAGFGIYDISDPDTCVETGWYDTASTPQDIAIEGSIAYIGGSSSIEILDISDPTAPSLLWSSSYFGYGLDVSGDLLFVAASGAGIRVYDVENPEAPVLLDFGQGLIANDVVIDGNYAYVAGSNGGLYILDASRPDSLFVIGQYSTGTIVERVAHVGEFVYVTDIESHLYVINVSDPKNPSTTGGGVYSLITDGEDIQIEDDYAYVPVGGAGICVFDIRYPDQVTAIDTLDTPGIAWAIDVAGDRAYVADYTSGIQIIDIADPVLPPRKIGQCPELADARAITLHGNYAYVTDTQYGLHTVDITEPAIPSVIGECRTPGDGWDVQIAGDIAYVADGMPDLLMVDISDPANPAWEGGYDWGEKYSGVQARGEARDICIPSIEDSIAYLADGVSGFKIFDLSNPTHPNKINELYNADDALLSVTVHDDNAYCADGLGGMQIFNVADPAQATHVRSFDSPGYCYGVEVENNLVFMADGESGLLVYDFTDPADPSFFGRHDTPGTAYHAVVDSPYVYIADGKFGMRSIDMTQRSPYLVGSIDTLGSALSVDINDTHACVAAGDLGIIIISVVDSTTPSITGSYVYEDPSYIRDLTYQNNTIFAADSLFGLRILDAIDPVNPVPEGAFEAQGCVTVSVADTLACIGVGTAGIHIISISDPSNPDSLGTYDTPGYVSDICINNGYAYIADGGTGIQIVDLSDPSSPFLAGSYDTPGNALGIACDDSLAFVADLDSLLVLDITTVASPQRLGSYYTAGTARRVSIHNRFAVLTDDTGGVLLIDISNPDNPVLAGQFSDGGRAFSAIGKDMNVLKADYRTGLQVIDFSNFAFLDSATWDPSWKTEETCNAYHIDIGSNKIAIVADYGGINQGIAAIDINKPDSLHKIDPEHGDWNTHNYPLTPGYSRRVVIRDSLAFVADQEAGLQVFDFDSMGSLTLLGSCGTPGYAMSIALFGDYAYVADDATGIWTIDIADPTSPACVGAFGSYGMSRSVDIRGNKAYIAGDGSFVAGCRGGTQGGLKLADISDPIRPVQRSFWQGCSGIPWDVTIAGNDAYLVDLENIWRIDITNPDSLYELSGDDDPFQAQQILVEGKRAFVADAWYGIYVYNIYDPLSTVRLVRKKDGLCRDCDFCCQQCPDYPNPGAYRIQTLYDIAITGNYAFLLDNEFGLWPFDITRPDTANYICPLSMPVALPDPQRIVVSGDYAYVTDTQEGLCILSVFSRRTNPELNTVISSTLNPDDSLNVARVNISTTQTDSIDWSLTADGGTTWQNISPDSDGIKISNPGSDLRWRAAMYDIGGAALPSCSNLAVDWWYQCAVIDSIWDVTEDQGGYVNVRFVRSGYDFADDSSPIVDYYIWRRIEDDSLVTLIEHDAVPLKNPRTETTTLSTPSLDSHRFEIPLCTLNDRIFIRSAQDSSDKFPDGVWGVVGKVPGLQQDTLIAIVPTSLDSASVVREYVYCISAHRETPYWWYVSPPDSGYSVDNIAPRAVQGASVAYGGEEGNRITWLSSPEEDLDHYRIYRDVSAEFTVSPSVLVHVTSDTFWTDLIAGAQRYHYKLTAIDMWGNESKAVLAESIDVPFIPDRFALYQNIPNPFNPETKITYDVPPSGGRVTVKVYDVAGRLVRTLVDWNETAGRKTALWHGRDDSGNRVASGVYFCRMTAPGYEQTKKMVLLK